MTTTMRVILLTALIATAASADVTGTVVLGTGGLIPLLIPPLPPPFGSPRPVDALPSPNPPFLLDFQFIDGSGAGDANNTVTLSNFNFGGGGIVSATTTGGVGISPSGAMTFTDTQFFNEALFGFVPGAVLTFHIDATENPDPLIPDTFTLAIEGLVATTDPVNPSDIPTNNPNFFDSFLELDLPVQGGSGTDMNLSQDTAGLGLSADFIPDVVTPTPEPSTLGVCFAILATGSLVRHRQLKR